MALVLRWPIREALLRYVHDLKAAALEAYRHETLIWAILSPYQKKAEKAPDVPKILKGN